MSIQFAAVGLSHNHIYNQTHRLLEAGAELVWFFGEEPERIKEFSEQFPQAQLARSISEILDDDSIHLITSAPIPDERAGLGIRVMQSGKDYLSSKPGFTTLDQLAEVSRVQAETKRIYSVYFGERFGNPASVKAGELVKAGAIGRVIQTTGFGPHKLLGHVARPDWTFQKDRHGGILNDLASHQVDQFLYFTDSTDAQVISAHVGNVKFPQYPELEDFGDMVLRSSTATGYIRVDWLTPAGLGVWGDVRLFILGTDGYIEIRKIVDVQGREGDNHLFWADQQTTHYLDCANVRMPFAEQFIQDILNRTENAMSQAHCFKASELALQAQAQARQVF